MQIKHSICAIKWDNKLSSTYLCFFLFSPLSFLYFWRFNVSFHTGLVILLDIFFTLFYASVRGTKPGAVCILDRHPIIELNSLSKAQWFQIVLRVFAFASNRCLGTLLLSCPARSKVPVTANQTLNVWLHSQLLMRPHLEPQILPRKPFLYC